MVNRKSVGWGRGETEPRPREVSEQAADNDDVITHHLTAGDLTVCKYNVHFRAEIVKLASNVYRVRLLYKQCCNITECFYNMFLPDKN